MGSILAVVGTGLVLGFLTWMPTASIRRIRSNVTYKTEGRVFRFTHHPVRHHVCGHRHLNEGTRGGKSVWVVAPCPGRGNPIPSLVQDAEPAIGEHVMRDHILWRYLGEHEWERA